MYHLLPIHTFCTHIKHYPEFCCVATMFEYWVMRQVKVSSLSSPLSQIPVAYAQILHILHEICVILLHVWLVLKLLLQLLKSIQCLII